MMLFGKRNRRRKEPGEGKLPALPWRRIVAWTLTPFAVAAALYGAGLALDQPVRAVAVEGPFQRVPAVQVEKAVTASLRGGFLTADLERVRRAVQAIPWVDHASVRRLWPSGLKVIVEEQVVAARWGDSGLLNVRGELFMTDARYTLPELPRLDGPEGSEPQVAERYLAIQGRLVEAGLRLSALRLDDRGGWELDLTNGVTVKLGRREVDERLDRFLEAAVPLVTERATDIRYVDLRYTNGFAVGWKTGSVVAHSKDNRGAPDA
ncbi:MAG TPA: cell division protein FtsQ/DivIB [Steroidobacteraceae bacterium]|nr:cell division protein FtsQ/DivIB [Steroidobacteraceae bacterium]